jgi:proteasome lid subunit RPN8/RPN11
METKLILTREAWQAMRRHVSRRAPQEACGLLAGTGSLVKFTIGVPNAVRSPVRFRMEPRSQWRAFQRIEAVGFELKGIYHSHPNGPDRPSRTDIVENMYPVAQIIWFLESGSWQVRGYFIEAGEAIEIALELRKGE